MREVTLETCQSKQNTKFVVVSISPNIKANRYKTSRSTVPNQDYPELPSFSYPGTC